ncbi:hypothetical protein D3C79_897300 [compost metagenome]
MATAEFDVVDRCTGTAVGGIASFDANVFQRNLIFGIRGCCHRDRVKHRFSTGKLSLKDGFIQRWIGLISRFGIGRISADQADILCDLYGFVRFLIDVTVANGPRWNIGPLGQE